MRPKKDLTRKKLRLDNDVTKDKPAPERINPGVDEKLDLTGIICPINFVKTKLKLEDMETGQILELILDDGEPMRNVPRSIKEEGHKIVKVENLGKTYRLLVEKG